MGCAESYWVFLVILSNLAVSHVTAVHPPHFTVLVSDLRDVKKAQIKLLFVSISEL